MPGAHDIHLLRGPLSAPVPLCGILALSITRGTWQPTLATCPGCLRRLHKPKIVTHPTDPALLVPEKHFQRDVLKLATREGWLSHWVWNSKHSPDGWPDLFLVKDGQAVALELKRIGQTPTAAQQHWLQALGTVPGITTQWCTPAQWDWLTARLTAK
jgi:hypothetical protein